MAASARFENLRTLRAEVAAGETTCVQVVEGCLDRIGQEDGFLGAFVEVYDTEARRSARQADALLRCGHSAGPLHGLPVAVKDLFDIAGKLTSAGSRARNPGIARSTAAGVARLQEAGMIVLGKTHTVEYAFGGWGINKWMGTPRNPWDTQTHRIPGGSSSGSAVAVAAGLAPCALGTDTGGSIRIPAALNGLVGLKPTRELVSMEGCFAHSSTLDSIGPLARTVDDAASLLGSMLEKGIARQLRAEEQVDLSLPVAVVPDIERCYAMDSDVAAHYWRTVEQLARRGLQIQRVQLPVSLEDVMDQSGRLVAREAWQRHREYILDDALPFDPHVRERILAGRLVTDDSYRELLAAHVALSAQFAGWMRSYSTLLLPTVPRPAQAVAEVDPASGDVTLFTRLANFAHGCALSLPVGLSAAGLPVGMQLVGSAFQDSNLLAVARIVEREARFNSLHRIPERHLEKESR